MPRFSFGHGLCFVEVNGTGHLVRTRNEGCSGHYKEDGGLTLIDRCAAPSEMGQGPDGNWRCKPVRFGPKAVYRRKG